MTYFKKPKTVLALFERALEQDPKLTTEQVASSLAMPHDVFLNRLEAGRRERSVRLRTAVVQAAAVTTLEFDAPIGWEQWFLLQADNHHDSIFCNREMEERHLREAKERKAMVMIFGDLIDGMAGRFDPRRNMDELRPEYKRSDYYDYITVDTAKFLAPYADHIGLITDGNHELAILKNGSTDVLGRLVERLNQSGRNIKRGGYGGWVDVVCDLGEKTITKRIKYFHGSGGEAPVTRGVIQTNRQAVYLPDADIVVNGHSHNQYHVVICRERRQGSKVTFDIQHHIRVPGYKQDYGDGSSGWNVTKGGVPKPIGAAWLILRRLHDDIKIMVISDVDGPQPVNIMPEPYTGIVYAQDSEGQ